MARLAFVSPLPPAPTGIADYAADVIRMLGPRHAIDAFGSAEPPPDPLPGAAALHHADTLLERHRADPYDLVVYQLGNSAAHGFEYPLLTQLPGLVVLHDLVLHHARAREILDGAGMRAYAREPWRDDLRAEADGAVRAYRALVAREHPGEAERIVAAQLGTVGDLLPYAYPLSADVVAGARAVAVHNAAMEDAIAEAAPGVPVTRVVMPAERAPVRDGDVARTRAALGLGEHDFVIGCLGLVTREKRIETVARALARVTGAIPGVRLLLVGDVADRTWLHGVLARCGVAGRTVVAGRVSMDALAAHVAAADVVVHLRWPTARETSAALLRVLAQGRPVVMSDIENFADIPDDAVVRVDVADEEGEVTRALLRLHERGGWRGELGAHAAAHVAAHHGPSAVADSYDRAITLALGR